MVSLLYWLMKGIPLTGKSIKPRTDLRGYYQTAADSLKIPVQFVVAHAYQESRQRLLATGALDEYGLWQFLPSTWENLMGKANWQNITNQVTAYIKHGQWIIEKLNLDMNSSMDRAKFLWVWNAGYGNFLKKRMPSTTKDYIDKILGYEKLVELW